MSRIRDLLEHYRMPPEVEAYLADFKLERDYVNGYEERYYYNSPIRMIVDYFTEDGVRYRRIYYNYNNDIVLEQIVDQYDYGTKQTTRNITLDANDFVTDVVSEEVNINVTWTDLPPSTGWPSPPGGGISGEWIIIDSATSAEVATRYMANTSGGAFIVTLPSGPSMNDTIVISDYAGTFGSENLQVARNGSNIMGDAEDLYLNVDNITVQLVYIDATQGWRVVTIST